MLKGAFVFLFGSIFGLLAGLILGAIGGFIGGFIAASNAFNDEDEKPSVDEPTP